MSVSVPFAYALLRARDGIAIIAGAGEREERSISEYYEYTGDPRARSNPSGVPEGRKNARANTPPDQLVADSESAITAAVIDSIVQISERE